MSSLLGASTHIAIVGGGPGGLLVAWALQQAANFPYTVTLFESSSRLGGKIRSHSFAAAPVSYEAGAAELYDYSHLGFDPLKELVLSLGLRVQPMGGRAVSVGTRIFADAHHFTAASGEETRQAIEAFDRRARKWMSPKEYYDSDSSENTGSQDLMLGRTFAEELDRIKDEPAREYIETLVHSDLATEPHLTSAAYGLQNYLMNDPAYMHLYTIEGGIERLPEALIAKVQAKIRLNTRVAQIESQPSGELRVTVQTHAAMESEDFDIVIVALPNTHLASIGWRGSSLPAAMRRHHSTYDHPAHYLRVSILFREIFWTEHLQESYLMLDCFGGCCLYDESSRQPCPPYGALGWLLAGEAAMTLSNLPDEAIVQRVLSNLPAFLQSGHDLVLEARVHRWTGEVNGVPGGWKPVPLQARHVPDPQTPNLMLVGDYLFDSTLNGVYDSASFVVEHMCSRQKAKASAQAAQQEQV